MRRVLVSLVSVALVWSAAASAGAQCMVSRLGCASGRPAGLLATFACACDAPGVCNIGEFCSGDPAGESCPDTGMHATCESRIWHARNDNSCIPSLADGLDPSVDCSAGVETFSPTCALTFRVLTRGTAQFRNAFGWYEARGTRPSLDDLHVMLDCDSTDGDTVVLDVRSDPAYRGGPIGFFLLTPEGHSGGGGTAACAGGDCCASIDRYRGGAGFLYFSEPALSDDGSVTHLYVYDSRVWDRKFYFAWEDTFGRSNFDFTDLVTSVEGVECAGAGEPCETGALGACAAGVTHCEDGTLSCSSIVMPEGELCNGVDDDCDGEVDDGAPCAERQVCDQGRCVPHCRLSDEFVCAVDFECDADSGLCVEIACRGVSCSSGQICRGGVCAGECEGVVCPRGQRCFRDRCIDPCEGVSCGAGQVCRGGRCVAGCGSCDGIVCSGSLTCETAGGECRDPSCSSECPRGTFCRAGTCVDGCEGAICPRGAACAMGECARAEGGLDAGVPSMPTDAGAGGMDAGPTRARAPSGCSCAVASRPDGRLALCALFVWAASLARRRRERRHRE